MARYKLSTFIGAVVVVLSYFGSVGIISNIVTSQGICTEPGAIPCENGGSCLSGYCSCQAGYSGMHCEIEITSQGMCAVPGARQCENGGICLSSGICNCPAGYTGAYCESFLSIPCVDLGETECQNGGTCHSSGYCYCRFGYTGTYCESLMCNGDCWNGGTCVQLSSSERICLCTANFTGATCQETVTYLAFEELNYAVLETSNRVNLRILRTGDLAKTSSVHVETLDDTAWSGFHYRGLSKVLTFEPYITNLTVAIDIINSNEYENLKFWVVLSNSINGSVQSPNGAALVNVLNTNPDGVDVFPLIDPVIASESDGTVEVRFLRSGLINDDVQISVRTKDGTMNQMSPYYVPLRDKLFTIRAGKYMLRVRVNLTDNTMPEDSRFFYLEYSVVDGDTNNSPPRQVRIEIQDDDSPILPDIGPSIGVQNPSYVMFAGTLPYWTNEISGKVQIPIYRIGNLNRTTEIVIYTSNGTALVGEDYQAVNRSFTMSVGTDVYQLNITIMQDAIYEGTEEYFLVTLGVRSGGQLARPNEETVRVIIRPDTLPKLLISLDSSQYEVLEGGTISIEVLREVTSGTTSGSSIVELNTISGTAVAGEDFVDSSQIVYFDSDETVKYVSIRILDDTIPDFGSKVFRVELKEVVYAELIEPYTAIVTIIDASTEVTTTIQPNTLESTTLDLGGQGESTSVIPFVIGAIGGVIVIFGVVLVVLYFCCKRRAARPKEESGGGDVPLANSRKFARDNSYLNRGYLTPQGQGTLAPMSSVNPETREYPRDQLRFHEEIGAGAFAVVYRAEAVGIHRPGLVSTVAIKMLKKTASESDKSDFMKELDVFKMLDRHANVMSLLGCCTKEEPLYIILDYMPHGNLQSYLQRVRTGKERDHPGYLDATQRIIQPEEVLLYSSQVARGMEYLGSKECIHRDLATRNILLGEDHVCKVSDFGLARDVAGEQQYEMKSKGRVPVRWLAPECLLHNTYTSKSDVWSFGVLMWELVTQGSHPYPGMSSQQVIKQVQHGYRLPKPDCCSQDIYDLMYSCWKEDPEERPTFQNLRKSIEDMLSNAQGYLLMDCFQQDDYVYISPGQESDDEDGLNEAVTAGKTNGKDKLTE